jgi:hypothetical protein
MIRQWGSWSRQKASNGLGAEDEEAESDEVTHFTVN